MTLRTWPMVSPTSAMRVRAPLGQIGSGQRLRTHPLGAGPRLAGAAAAEQEPGVPGLAAGGEDPGGS